ncbi:MAG: signal peptidase I [Lachnospiraceae bacterium]|nr:signal peptidase I [Lachnospiraceae bacterium]
MAEAETMRKEEKKKGGGILPAVCNILGTLILFSVILLCIPVTLPKLFGYQIYDVVSGSMEPEIPVDSVVYVKETLPEEIKEGDVAAFRSSGSVIIHRIVEKRIVEGQFITKGDANTQVDIEKIPYDAMIGVVTFHIPFLGVVMTVLTSNVGKAYLICYAASGAMFYMLAGRLKEERK